MADRVGVISQGRTDRGRDKKALMARMGKKTLEDRACRAARRGPRRLAEWSAGAGG